MMDRFHLIEDAAAILVSKGVFRQAKVFRRGAGVYAAYGAGYIRLYRDGTSLPNVRCEAVDVPGVKLREDEYRRLVYEAPQ